MLALETTAKYRKDRKLMKKQGKDLSLLDSIIKKLQNRETLEAKHRDHPLMGNFSRLRECHIAPDWLLIYAIDNNRLVLTASRTGSHSDLF
jgi:mRNA interferase YafQ